MASPVEAQKAESVLHIHAFVYIQMIAQFDTLLELGEKLQKGLTSAQAMKEYISYTRCASYPDLNRFLEERDHIEQTWPAYADDLSLSRLPSFFGTHLKPHLRRGGTDMPQRPRGTTRALPSESSAWIGGPSLAGRYAEPPWPPWSG